jgi:hypothetical protein
LGGSWQTTGLQLTKRACGLDGFVALLPAFSPVATGDSPLSEGADSLSRRFFTVIMESSIISIVEDFRSI